MNIFNRTLWEMWKFWPTNEWTLSIPEDPLKISYCKFWVYIEDNIEGRTSSVSSLYISSTFNVIMRIIEVSLNSMIPKFHIALSNHMT